jgi:hypothetical protein
MKQQKNNLFFSDKSEKVTEMIISSFLDADIPLDKLNNSKIKKLFKKLGHDAPTTSTARRMVTKISDDHFKNIRIYFLKKYFKLRKISNSR